MQAEYPVKVQVIRSKNQKPRYYIPVPGGLAGALGLEGGEEVQWEILDRDELHLFRLNCPPAAARSRTTRK